MKPLRIAKRATRTCTPVLLDDTLSRGHWLGSGGVERRLDLAELKIALGERSAALVLPTTVASWRVVAVPRKNRAAALRALPFRFEDQIPGDIDQQTLIHGAPDEHGLCQIMLVASAPWQTLLERLEAAELSNLPIIPECVLLPPGETSIVVLSDRETATILRRGQHAYAIDAASLPWALSRELAQHHSEGEIQTIQHIACNGADSPVLDGIHINLTPATSRLTAFQLPDQLPAHWPVARLSHQTAAGRQSLAVGARRLAGLAAASLFLATASAVLDWWQWDRRLDQTYNQQINVLSDFAPGIPVVGDPRAQLAGMIRVSDTPAGLLALLRDAAPLIAQAPVDLQTLELRNNALSLQVSAPSVTEIETIRVALSPLGSSEIVRIDRNSDSVNAAVQVNR